MVASKSATPDDCPHRQPLSAAQGEQTHFCALALRILGARDPSLCAVVRPQCEVCCRQRIPLESAPNPVVSTSVFKAARKIKEAGGVEGCDVAQADTAMAFAVQFLAPIDRPASAPSPSRTTPPYTVDCRYLGPHIGGRECKGCRGKVRLKLFACLHPDHTDTTLRDCRHCGDYQPVEEPEEEEEEQPG
jgi:hypothetical protein